LWPFVVQGAPQNYGTQATAIALEGAPAGTADLQLIPLRTGNLITTENIRASIQALYDTGRYAYIEVDATPADGGTRLTFRVRPHYFFSSFRLEPDDILERPISGYMRIPVGEKFSRSNVERIVEQVDRLIDGQGYFEATITPEYQLDDASRLAHVTLKVERGPRAARKSASFK
jgi:outer membrane protein assembly factor BamA